MAFHVRRAKLADLEKLVSFAVSEANEAEGIAKEPESARKGVRTAVHDDSIAMYWVLEKDNSEVFGAVSIVKEWSD